MKKSITLTKHYSRERSLFYCVAWSENNMVDCQNWLGLGIKNLVFLKKTGDKKVSIWYDPIELEAVRALAAKKCTEDPVYFNRVKDEFTRLWARLFPFVSGQKSIESIDELKEFYRDWIRWWSPMAHVVVIPDRTCVQQAIRVELLGLREKTQEYSDAINAVFTRFFQSAFPEYRDLADIVTPEEVFSLKEGPFTDSELESIKKRIQGFAIVNGDLCAIDSLELSLGKEGLLLDNDSISQRDLNGMVACKGIARGRVGLVLSKNDLRDFQEGDILVTEMTAPEYVPAMKKAAAIVTDEGGITCHAAIVSRELNKPCIVGTKNATQILKEGDVVEVDADKGQVRKINK